MDSRGRIVATFTEDGSAVQLINAESGLTRATLTGQTGELQSVSFSPDGTTLAATSADGLAVVWDARTGRTLFRFDTGAGAAAGVAYSADAATLYVGKPLTRQLQAWDLSGDRRFLAAAAPSQIPPYGAGRVAISSTGDAGRARRMASRSRRGQPQPVRHPYRCRGLSRPDQPGVERRGQLESRRA